MPFPEHIIYIFFSGKYKSLKKCAVAYQFQPTDYSPQNQIFHFLYLATWWQNTFDNQSMNSARLYSV